METKTVRLADIKPAPYNPRVKLTEKDQEYKALNASITESGLVLPLIVNARDNCLIGGHQRLSVLLAAGETETNAVIVDMDEAQAKALCIALNKLDGEWDYGQLSELLQELIEEGENLIATGFTDQDINELLADVRGKLEDGGDAAEEDDGGEQEADGDYMDELKCMVGEYKFSIGAVEFEDMMADVREKVGFTQARVHAELKRRFFGEI